MTDRGSLVVSASMESAGSGWLFNLTNEVLQAAGQTDVRTIRERYGLGDIMRWDNCNIRDLDDATWTRLQPALDDGHTFVVKSHRPPTALAQKLCTEGKIAATYIHRDPRDVVVSAYQRGKIRRANGHHDSFARLRTIDLATAWMRFRQIPVYEAWRDTPNTLIVRYEDLAADGRTVVGQLAGHLGITVSDEARDRILSAYSGDRASQQTGSHYRGGGRRRDEMTAGQLWRCNRLCGSAIRSMGYEL
jgi:hypothetical protein